jgi:hypothetical protein
VNKPLYDPTARRRDTLCFKLRRYAAQRRATAAIPCRDDLVESGLLVRLLNEPIASRR